MACQAMVAVGIDYLPAVRGEATRTKAEWQSEAQVPAHLDILADRLEIVGATSGCSPSFHYVSYRLFAMQPCK